MGVVDLGARRYANDAVAHAKKVLEEAEESIDQDDPVQAGLLAVEAWIILNGAAITARRLGAKKITAEVKETRKKVTALGGALQVLGYALETNVPEASMAFVARRKET